MKSTKSYFSDYVAYILIGLCYNIEHKRLERLTSFHEETNENSKTQQANNICRIWPLRLYYLLMTCQKNIVLIQKKTAPFLYILICTGKLV
jgi:hypothetical protein